MELPQFETLRLTLEEGVAHVELNRPDKANSMSPAMWDEIDRCFGWIDGATDVRVAVLSGRGRHFCAGIDLAMLAELEDATLEAARRAESRRKFILRLQDKQRLKLFIHEQTALNKIWG